jgi:hypothetical protein
LNVFNYYYNFQLLNHDLIMDNIKTTSHTIFPPAGSWNNDVNEKSHSIFPPAGSWDSASEKSHSIFPPAGRNAIYNDTTKKLNYTMKL